MTDKFRQHQLVQGSRSAAAILDLVSLWDIENLDSFSRVLPRVRDQVADIEAVYPVFAATELVQYLLEVLHRTAGQDRDALIFDLRQFAAKTFS